MTLIWFILILSIIIVVHEFGHFLFARISGTHVYEFSLGMGKKIWSKKSKKYDTEFCLRLIPLGGFVQLAGEDEEFDKENKIDKNKSMNSKTGLQRFLILFAGAGFNFILALVVLFISALIYGSVSTKPVVGSIMNDYPAAEAGLKVGDKILKIDGKTVKTWDDVLWEVQFSDGTPMKFLIEREGETKKQIKITPIEIEDEQGNKVYKFGIGSSAIRERGLVPALKYGVNKFASIFKIMLNTVKSLFVGDVGVNDFSGPVGIYTVVDAQREAGFESILYLIAFLSVNVGVINLIPFPAFDGGRILFLLIEKITKKPVPARVENMIHSIGFFILIALMIYVTFNDVIKLIK